MQYVSKFYVNKEIMSKKSKSPKKVIYHMKAKINASSDTHQLHTTSPLYNIIIIFDTVFRQKRNLKHEK